MSVFVDTSALYSLLVRTEEEHGAVADAFETALDEGRTLVTTNYVAVETVALLQTRIGLAAVADLANRVLPVMRLHWVDEALHRRAVEELIRTDRRGISLVDTVSFLLMESEGVRVALALDRDFEARGFGIIPS